jgi:gliding motility-associated-like protein
VTDNDNCDVNFDVTLSQPDSLSFDINQTSAADCGENTGSVLVINPLGGNGIYTYEIIGQGGPQTSTLFDSLASGNYTMLMLDGNNCQNSSTFTINGTSILNYTVASNSISCFAENDGSISLGNLNGGFAPFSLSLDNGATFSNATFRNDTTISNLLSGDYDIVIRDSINCTYSFPNTISITEPDPIDAEVENITMTDVDSATGRLAIYNIIGGSSPYEVSLDGSAFFSVSLNPLTQTFDTVIEKLAVGFITVFIRDNNACLQDFEAFIEEYEFANRFTIPNIFTPNKDGFNDNFVIPKLPTGSKIKIFEKSGRPVYENDDYQNDWDGEEFVDGTYFYILDVPNQGIYRGFIEIFR